MRIIAKGGRCNRTLLSSWTGLIFWSDDSVVTFEGWVDPGRCSPSPWLHSCIWDDRLKLRASSPLPLPAACPAESENFAYQHSHHAKRETNPFFGLLGFLVLAWRIPGTVEPGGLPSMGSHRVGHDWSDLAGFLDPGCCQLLMSDDLRALSEMT